MHVMMSRTLLPQIACHHNAKFVLNLGTPFFSCRVCSGNELKVCSELDMSCSTRAGSSWRGEGRWDVIMLRMAGARGSHWVQMAVRWTRGSVCRESREEIFSPRLPTIFSIFSLSLR